MDRRQIELQIRIIRVTYRGEVRRHASEAMDDFRARAADILAQLGPAAEPYPDLLDEIAALRRDIGLEHGEG